MSIKKTKVVKIVSSLVITVVTGLILSAIVEFQALFNLFFWGGGIVLPFPILKYCGSVTNLGNCLPTYYWWGIILSIIFWIILFYFVYTFRQTSWKRRLGGFFLILAIFLGATYSVDKRLFVLRFFSEPLIQNTILEFSPNNKITQTSESVSTTMDKIGGKLPFSLPDGKEVVLSIPLNALPTKTLVSIKKLNEAPNIPARGDGITIIPGTIFEVSFSGQKLSQQGIITVPLSEFKIYGLNCVMLYDSMANKWEVPSQFITRDGRGLDVFISTGSILATVEIDPA